MLSRPKRERSDRALTVGERRGLASFGGAGCGPGCLLLMELLSEFRMRNLRLHKMLDRNAFERLNSAGAEGGPLE